MIRQLRAWWTRRQFERLFFAEMKKVALQQKRHAKVEPTRAELQARVHEALRVRGSA